jgi:hypothetical protein
MGARFNTRDIASNLYQSTRFKRRLIHIKLQNFKWIRNLGQINTPAWLEEYAMLFTTLSSIQLNDQTDEITWRWMTNEKYTMASTYECQFNGAMMSFSTTDLWKAYTEPKCRFFLLCL